MQAEFVELDIYFHQLDAEVIKGLLAENGIESRISSDDCGGMMPNLQFSEGVRLHVARNDLLGARELIRDCQKSTKYIDSDAQAEGNWACSNCGEILEAQFTDCWNCGSSR